MLSHRKTVNRGFLLLKVAVVLLIEFSIIGFLDEAATRLQMRMPQPFRSIAILAIAVASAYPFTLMVDAVKRNVQLEPEEDLEVLDLNPVAHQSARPQRSALERTKEKIAHFPER